MKNVYEQRTIVKIFKIVFFNLSQQFCWWCSRR